MRTLSRQRDSIQHELPSGYVTVHVGPYRCTTAELSVKRVTPRPPPGQHGTSLKWDAALYFGTDKETSHCAGFARNKEL